MGNLFNKAGEAPVAGKTVTTDKEGRPQSQTWLNIGVEVDIPNPNFDVNKAVSDSNPETVKSFVGMPVGIPLETTEPVVAKGQNQNWLNTVQLKNLILSQLQGAAAELAPGEGVVIEGLQMQIFRRNVAAAAPAEGTNPLVEQFKALSVVKAA